MTPEQFRQAFMQSRGMTLDSNPMIPTPVQTMPIAPTPAAPMAADPTRLLGSTWGPQGPPPMGPGTGSPVAGVPAGVPPMPMAPPPVTPTAFPTGGAPPVPNVPAATGPAGITLNSAPVAPGWAGSTDIPAPDKPSADFAAGANQEKLLGGLEQIAKGIKPKSGATDLNTITPMSSQPNTGGAGSAELMAQMLANRRRNYGMSLTG